MSERFEKEAQSDSCDLEIIPDCEYGYIARYKSLTADGKTPDEAMTNLAEVILLALSPNGPPDALLEQMGEALKALLRGPTIGPAITLCEKALFAYEKYREQGK
ncbi:MAG: hypothetical protein SAMD01599839_08140 [Rectinema sp.]